jgi:hypothetical protein
MGQSVHVCMRGGDSRHDSNSNGGSKVGQRRQQQGVEFISKGEGE